MKNDDSSESHYRTLLEISNLLTSHLGRRELMDALFATLKAVLPFDIAGLSLLQEDGGLLMYAITGDPTDGFFSLGHKVGLGSLNGGKPFDVSKPLIRRDLSIEREYVFEEHTFSEGSRSHIVVPLAIGGRDIGCFGIASSEVGQYSETDLDFLGQIGKQVALAVSNMLAYEKSLGLNARIEAMSARRQALLELNNQFVSNLTEDSVFASVAKVLRGSIEFEQAGIHLFYPELNESRVLLLDGVASKYFYEGQRLKLLDAEAGFFDVTVPRLVRDLDNERVHPIDDMIRASGNRSYCFAPIKRGSQVIGLLGVGSPKKDFYTEEDLAFIQEASNQLSLAVTNLRSFNEIQELSEREAAAARRRETLLEINNTIITNLDRDALLTTMLPALQGNIPLDLICLSIYDRENDSYRIEAIGGPAGSQHFKVGQVIERQDGYVADEFDMEHPLLRSDLEVDRTNNFEEVLYAEGLRSFCAVPLRVGGDLLGALCVGSKTPGQYGRNDVEFLQEIGNQVALAFANAAAYEEIGVLKSRLQAENVYLQEEILKEHNFEEIVGNSPALLNVLQQIERVAPTSATVLIAGETGTGKELVARAIHNFSERKDRPLVKINCGAISAGLVESELFGHVKGAFTGATDKRVGRFELANGGTIFLDEVGELSLETQVKLLRVLQEGEYEPVGSSRTLKTDVRVIAATNRDLTAEIDAGRFRLDLYYRLNVFPIRVPPLRHRREDIPALILFFVERFGKKFGKRVSGVPATLMETFLRYRWKGNIRELQNLIERAVVLSDPNAELLDGSLIPDLSVDESLIPGSDDPVADWGSLPVSGEAPLSAGGLKEMERQHIVSALQRTGWVIEGKRGAASLLAIHPNTLRSRMKRLGIERPTIRPALPTDPELDSTSRRCEPGL